MKKINCFVLLIISLFVSIGIVSAKSVASTCNYNNNDNSMASKGAVTITIYDDGSSSAVITYANGKQVDNKENVSNWNSIKGTYQSKKECPYYVIMNYGGIGGASVSAYYDKNEAISNQGKGTMLGSSTLGETSEGQDAKNSAIADIKSWANTCNSVASTNFNPKSCENDDKITTRFSDCVNNAKGQLTTINNHISQANGYISKSYISESDSNYKSFKSVCESATKNLNEYLKALQYINNKEYNEIMGTNIESSVTDKDVSNNKYVRDYYGSTPSDMDTGFLQICDPNENPQIVASTRLVGIAITIVKIIVPIIMIIMGSIDMAQAVVSKDQSALQKQLIVLGRRLAIGALVFFAPSVILGLFHMIDGIDSVDSKFSTCMDCILGSDSCPDAKFIGN